MKTPMQELIEKINNVKPTEFCSIETIRGWAEELLEKEKEVMCRFTDGFQIDCTTKYLCRIMSPEQYYNITFENE